MTPEAKIVQYLEDAHAAELAGIQTLNAHAAITPPGVYRDLLERHLQETRAQAGRLEDRLAELGSARNPITATLGFLETAIGQALAIGKAPIDMLRGPGGAEKLLKNAKDECATEALEIATYDALEALADAVGDPKTATLVREIRTQEELTLKHLRELIPALTRDVVKAEMTGATVPRGSTTGAADAASKVAHAAAEEAEQASRGGRTF